MGWHYTSGRLQHLSLSMRGTQLVGFNSDHEAFAWTYTTGWQEIPGETHDITASEDGYHIWRIGPDYSVYYCAGLSAEWAQVPGKLARMHASHDGSKVWGI